MNDCFVYCVKFDTMPYSNNPKANKIMAKAENKAIKKMEKKDVKMGTKYEPKVRKRQMKP